MNAVVADGVSVAFDGTVVLRDLSISVPHGAWIALIGPNGAGKTTLLRAIARAVPYLGEIHLNGTSTARLDRRSIARSVAFVPQRPHIPSAMTVTEYVLMGRSPYIPYLGTEKREDVRVATEVIERLELEPFALRNLGSLSGGELQRVVLARALAQQAPVLLLDEPTSALDVGHQQQVLELVDLLRQAHGLTVLSAMHDLTLTAQYADELVLVDEGREVARGDATDVLTEELVARHYGASVRVITDSEQGVAVVPVRRPRVEAAQAE